MENCVGAVVFFVDGELQGEFGFVVDCNDGRGQAAMCIKERSDGLDLVQVLSPNIVPFEKWEETGKSIECNFMGEIKKLPVLEVRTGSISETFVEGISFEQYTLRCKEASASLAPDAVLKTWVKKGKLILRSSDLEKRFGIYATLRSTIKGGGLMTFEGKSELTEFLSKQHFNQLDYYCFEVAGI
ncbi:hypothetical protein [Vibrio barjaei]|uniref:hypothetical protein n=1 Tax=Vibrio barjaei TaxID=1676683 RepID=UPI0022846FE4|nr:hypothetical protein [Vibrio barjaei]MCY9873836.1 hypothetical protein [Vibrio barjaei]